MANYTMSSNAAAINAGVSEVIRTGNKVVARLSGYGAPTAATVGETGDHYTDLSTDGKEYRCKGKSGSKYLWEKVGSGIDEGVVFTPSIIDGYLHWSNDAGLPNPEPVYINGADGTSPTVSVQQTSAGVQITITDADGTTTADITDGVSPTASVQQTSSGARITVTDASGTTTADLTDGVDGFSPSVSVAETTAGVTITITDADGTTSANLKNGYRIGSVYLKSGSTASGQTAVYGLRLNDTAQTEVGTISVYNGTDGQGTGDMMKSVYDANNNGVVDTAENAQKLGGQLPSYYASASSVPSTASDVGADPAGTASSAVSSHNTSNSAHNDLRLLISDLADRLNAIADSDDTTLDQLSEIVTYIKANRDLISGVTTSKVSVSDIVNNLTTPVTNKPLSAAQGVALAALIAEKSDFSGDYNDLDNQPAIPATASDVGADPAGTAASTVASHDGDDSAHTSLFAAKQNSPSTATSFPASGSALADNTIYTVSTNVGVFQFVAPTDGGWAHGTFTKGSSGSITFGSGADFVGGSAPTFTSGKKYEFDVLDGAWVFVEVSS